MLKSATRTFLSIAAITIASPPLYSAPAPNSIAIERISNLKASAEKNDASAQYELGYSYLNGTDVPRDKLEAIKLIKRSAENGFATAQSQLGTLYFQGNGVPQDMAEAIRWWNSAAEKHDTNAESQLGFAYLLGDGVKQSNVEAYMWFNIAAADGDQHAIKDRDAVAQKMKAEQIALAQRQQTEWMQKHPKKP